MKLFFISAVVAVLASTPGALAYDSSADLGTSNSESSPSSDVQLIDPISSDNEVGTSNSESSSSSDVPVNAPRAVDNLFIALGNPNNPNCDGIGPNTCDRRIACEWICETRRGSDRDRGCCVRKDRPTRRPTRRPNRRPTRRPTRSPTRRPTSNSNFDDGLREGRRQANRIWRDLGNSCSRAWGSFQDTIQRRIRSNGWNSSSGTWRTRAFNEGAVRGMNEVVTQKSKECFHDSADECVDLGNEAARMIAYDHCASDLGVSSSGNAAKWRRECRDAAIDQCRGQMFSAVRNECGSSPSTGDLRSLQNKCRNKVLFMIGDI